MSCEPEVDDGTYAVYLRGGEYVADEDRGPEGRTTLAISFARAERLAWIYNSEREDIMAKNKKGEAKATKAKKAKTERSVRLDDKRLPATGTRFSREYKGKTISVYASEKGLIWEGETYASLSALAKAATGYKTISGFQFFGKALKEAAGKSA